MLLFFTSNLSLTIESIFSSPKIYLLNIEVIYPDFNEKALCFARISE